MSAVSVVIEIDGSPALAVIDELFAELAKRPLETRQAVLCRLEALEQPFCIQGRNDPAVAAGEVLLVLDASDGLLCLLAAVRAGDFDD